MQDNSQLLSSIHFDNNTFTSLSNQEVFFNFGIIVTKIHFILLKHDFLVRLDILDELWEYTALGDVSFAAFDTLKK
jgi:hypothetical protein